MAGVVRSGHSLGRVLTACRVFSRAACTSRAAVYYVRRDQLPIKPHVPQRCASSLAAEQRVAQPGRLPPQPGGAPQLDRALQRIDNEVRRTGRVARRDLDDLLAQVSALGEAGGRLSGPQGLLLVRMCGAFLCEEAPAVRSELARGVWAQLGALGCPLDASHYNALLQAYLDNEFPFDPAAFLADMEAQGVAPNRVTFQRLIHRYCQQGDIAGASKILEHMKSQDLAINERVFNSLILGHFRAGDPESAWGVLEVMRNARLEPTADTFHALLCGCAERGDQAGLERALREADRAEVFLADDRLLDVCRVSACAGHDSLMDMVLERMRRLAGYTQDCISTCLQLSARGCHEAAYRLLLTMETPRSENHGNFFVAQLVRQGAPLDRILHYCRDLHSRGLNRHALARCAELALGRHQAELALGLLREMHSQGLPVRPHYFYPLVLAQAGNEQALLALLSTMSELGVEPTSELLSEYLLPALDTQDAAQLVDKLRGLGLSVSAVVNPLVRHYLDARDPAKALALVDQYPVNLAPALVVPALAACYRETRNASATVQLLARALKGPEATATGTSRRDWGGRFLMESLGEQPADHLASLVPEMVAHKVQVSRATVDTIRSRYSPSAPILDMLDQISSENLEDSGDSSARMPSQNEMSIEELEAHLVELQSKGMNTRGALRRLLLLHCRFRHADRAVALAEELERDGCAFTGAMHAQLLDLFVATGDLERARQHLAKVAQVDPDFRLDAHKVLSLAALEASQGHPDAALALLEQQQPHQPPQQSGGASQGGLERVGARLLGALVASGVDAERALSLLVGRQWVTPSAVLLGPLVRAPMENGDLPAAVQALEECARRYRLTPHKGELSRRLIQEERSQELQRVVDISTEVHGEMNTLYDLMSYFLECGHMRQAQKILETPGLRARHHRLDTICDNFLRRNMVTQLEQLVAITRGLFDVNRDRLYHFLFRAYGEAEADRALEAWAQMQEENVQPSEATLRLLAGLLERAGRPLPFTPPPPPAAATREAAPLVTMDLDAALERWRSGDMSNSREGARLLEALVKQGRVREALRVAEQLLSSSPPAMVPLRSLRQLAGQLAARGDTEALATLRPLLSDRQLRQLSFDNQLGTAYVHSGRSGELLEQLEASPGEWAVGGRCPTGALVGLLEQQPQMADRVLALGRTYGQAHACWAPLNALWMHRVLLRDYSGADQLLQEFPDMGAHLMFSPVLRESRDKKDVSMARHLVETLSRHGGRQGGQELAQSNLIRVLAQQEGGLDEALKLVEQQGAEKVAPWALAVLQDALLSAGRTVPFQVPATRGKGPQSQEDASSETSEDSSDDEERRK
ncbi:leucine-rich PPR motif-containing protein, mitochondrial-like [Haemaphysalis longicornis]